MLVAVFAAAAATRCGVLLSRGPLDAASYDQSVYYAAAVALVHGRFPYHGDFVFVHPPVIALAGAPFALLGRLTNDPTGFVAENAAFALVGALNAVLVVVVAHRWSLGRGAAAAGLGYALWPGGFVAESTARLEPLGNFFFLLFLWALGRGRGGATRSLVVAGVLAAVLVNVKVWWSVPVVVAVAFTAWHTRTARIVAVPAAAAGLTALVLDLPFLVTAGPRMVSSILTDQLHRPDAQWVPGGHLERLSAGQRLEDVTGARQAVAALAGLAPASADALTVALVTAVVAAAMIATAVAACRVAAGRVFVAVLAAQVVVLLTAPVYYPYYGAYVPVTTALVVAAATAGITRWRAAVPWVWAVAAALAGGIALQALEPPAHPVDWTALRRQTVHVRCLVSDSPYSLIRLHALDRSFEPGCRNVVDTQGVAYGAGPDPRAKAAGSSATPAYRQFFTDYLTSGEAVVLSEATLRVRLGAAATRRITSGPLIGRSGNVAVWWTR